MTGWITTRMIYLVDAFVNFNYNTLTVLSTLPYICTFSVIGIAIYNL